MKKANITVRRARFERGDIARLIVAVEELYKDLQFIEQGIGYDPVAVGSHLGSVLANDHQAVFIAEDGDQMIGFVLCFIAPSIFDGVTPMVTDGAWWLKPEYREGSAIKQLMSAIKNWAKNNNSGWLHAHLTNKKLRIKSMRISNKEGAWAQQQHL